MIMNTVLICIHLYHMFEFCYVDVTEEMLVGIRIPEAGEGVKKERNMMIMIIIIMVILYKKSCTGLWMRCRRPRISSRELLSKCDTGERK